MVWRGTRDTNAPVTLEQIGGVVQEYLEWVLTDGEVSTRQAWNGLCSRARMITGIAAGSPAIEYTNRKKIEEIIKAKKRSVIGSSALRDPGRPPKYIPIVLYDVYKIARCITVCVAGCRAPAHLKNRRLPPSLSLSACSCAVPKDCKIFLHFTIGKI